MTAPSPLVFRFLALVVSREAEGVSGNRARLAQNPASAASHGALGRTLTALRSQL